MALAVRYGTIVESVKDTKIPKDEVIVVGGAAMQLLGLKKTRDIDVVVIPEQMFKVMGRLLEHPNGRGQRYSSELGRLSLLGRGQAIREESDFYSTTYGNLSYMLAPHDHLYSAVFEELQDEALDIDGVLVSPPERILAWKQGVNRPKDQADIALLQEYLTR